MFSSRFLVILAGLVGLASVVEVARRSTLAANGSVDASTTPTFVYEGKGGACSACAAEAANSTFAKGKLTSGELIPGELEELEGPVDRGSPNDRSHRIKSVSDSNFAEFVNEQSGLVMVDFYADWCGPCKVQGTILEEMTSSLENVTVLKVNVDESPRIAAKFQIESIPALLVFQNGELVNSSVGVANAEQVKTLVSVTN